MIQEINLYQPILRQSPKVFSARTMTQIVGVVIVALLALYAWGLWQTHALQAHITQLQQQQSRDNATLTRLEVAITEHQPSTALTQALVEARRDVKRKQTLLKALSRTGGTGTNGFAPLLAGLAHTRIRGLWFTDIDISSAGSDLRLAGATTRSVAVPQLINKLAHVPAFSTVTFKQMKISRSHGAKMTFLLSTAAPEPQQQDTPAP